MKLSFLFVVVFSASLLSITIDGQTKRPKSKSNTGKTQTTKPQQGTLSVETGLVFKSGDVKPAARTQFHLLDKDLDTILREAGIERSETSRIEYFALLQSGKRKYGIVKDDLTKSEEAIKPHIIATMTTDFNGKGDFPSAKAGTYFLFGIGGTGQEVVIWNVPIDLKAGKQSATLDQNNAAEIW